MFEKSADRRDRTRSDAPADEAWNGHAEGRVSSLEKSVKDLAKGQTQIQTAVSAAPPRLPLTFIASTDPVHVATAAVEPHSYFCL